ncbi:MAG: hypothetical protein LBV69_00395 [Bacteroidales bacterium]|jgi:hypothetical protein|nr:hypothetical protein [Bacteroidales bacterium]
MENTLNDLRDIFSILHDGNICAGIGNKKQLTLKVECQYLAELIDQRFEYFYIELAEVNILHFIPWMNPAELEQITLTKIPEIFNVNLEILSSELDTDLNCVKIICNQHDISINYCGGIIFLGCESVRIYDQEKHELTIEILDKICNKYWNEIFG